MGTRRLRTLTVIMAFGLMVCLSGCDVLFSAWMDEQSTPVATLSIAYPTATYTPLPPPQGDTPCYFNWARQEVPGLMDALQTMFGNTGLDHVRVTNAYEFGENCIDPATNAVRYFAAMDTTLDLAVTVENVGNAAAIQDTVERIVLTLREFPTAAPPHAAFGQMNLRFVDASASLNLTCDYQSALTRIEQGAGGDPCPLP